MTRIPDNYTRYPRAILWLVRGGTIVGPPAVEIAPFYLSKLPITNLQYEAFDAGHVRSACSPGDDDPAVGVEFERARAYCAWYAEVSRKPMRLPTEIEWEHACRAGTSGPHFAGTTGAELTPYIAVDTDGGVGDLSRVRPNGFGLLAMLGGVWEWTVGAGGPENPVLGVVRGGSYRTPVDVLTHALRREFRDLPDPVEIGFRVARSLR